MGATMTKNVIYNGEKAELCGINAGVQYVRVNGDRGLTAVKAGDSLEVEGGANAATFAPEQMTKRLGSEARVKPTISLPITNVKPLQKCSACGMPAEIRSRVDTIGGAKILRVLIGCFNHKCDHQPRVTSGTLAQAAAVWNGRGRS